jgi:hypothetical protein
LADVMVLFNMTMSPLFTCNFFMTVAGFRVRESDAERTRRHSRTG